MFHTAASSAGRTVYPDYLGNERTLAWLRRELKTMHDSVPYNGLWLDMNEYVVFVAFLCMHLPPCCTENALCRRVWGLYASGIILQI